MLLYGGLLRKTRCRTAACHPVSRALHQGRLLQCASIPSPIPIVRWSHSHPLIVQLPLVLPKENNPVRLAIGQGPQHYRVEGQTIRIVMPPSTVTVSPVMKSFVTSESTISATSSTVPSRCSGIRLSMLWRACSGVMF